MDGLLTKRVISVPTHYLIPDLLELFAHILRYFLKFLTVILRRKMFVDQISMTHISKLYIHTQCQDSPLSPALLAHKALSAFSTSPCCVWSAGLCYSPWRKPHPARYAGCLQWGLKGRAQEMGQKLKKAHECLGLRSVLCSVIVSHKVEYSRP